MSEAQKIAPAGSGQETTRQTNLLDTIVEEGRFGKEPASQERGKDIIKEFIGQVLQGEVTVSKDTEAMINARIAQIDHLISLQLNEILHAPAFQKLEGSWRGLKYLLDNTETSTMLKIRVLNVSKKELLKDLQRAAEFDQSATFKKIYEDEYGVFGGEPFAALIGDYEFTKHPEDIELLDRMSHVAAGAHAPFLTAAGPELMNLDSYTNLGTPRDIAKIFDSTEFAKWKSFRESEDARYVGLALPHILMRLPYGRDTKPVDGFNYEEAVDGTDHSKYLWGNAAYALGTRLTNAFAQYSWCAAIRGVEGGGLVEGLPAHTFRTDEGDVALKCPTEIAITDRREFELSNLGFLPLCHYKNTDYSVFFGAQSVQKAKKYDRPEATANAAISARLPYIMASSRFAHFLKVMARDKVGSFMEAGDVERWLNRWITNYVNSNENAGQEIKARFPLREARVEVREIPGRPGSYNAVAYLRPWLQMEELTTSLRMVARIPAAAG